MTILCVRTGRHDTTPLRVELQDGSHIAVWPVLAGAEGDMPIQRLLQNAFSHVAKHACFRCALNGHWCHVARTQRCVS